MKYIVIQRELVNSSWLVRVLESGNIEIMEHTREYYEDYTQEKETFVSDSETYFWDEWASKERWDEIWESTKEPNLFKTEFLHLEEALEFLNS